MMRHDELLVRTLKLRSSDDTQLLRARYRLEEAFRTASLPGLLPNAQVLIRHLDLGSIPADLSTVALAGRIGAMLRNLAAEAVCVDRESHADANVVWFSDPLQPYVTLLLYLLEGRETNAWYWRSLFPFRALSATGASMEWLLPELLQTAPKGLALSHMLRQVIEARRLPQLLLLISEALLNRLIHAQGLSPVAVASVSKTPTTRMITAPHFDRVWRDALRQTASTWGDTNLATRWLAWQALLSMQPERTARHDSLQRIDVAGWLRTWSMAESEAEAGVSEFSCRLPSAKVEEAVTLNFSETGSDAGFGLGKESESAPMKQRSRADDLNNALHAQASSSPFRLAQTESALGQSGVTLAPFTDHAGFAFVTPLLQRIGINELLQANEALIELDLPHRLLWAMANRFRLAHEDPAWKLFETFAAGGDELIGQVRIPLSWRRLTTASGRPLAKGEITSLDRLLDTLQLLAGVYLRRYCGMSLRALINRPGRVFITATHWDTCFDINDTDLRLRRVALDSDPGWVTWLGRVVQFHYDSPGKRHV